jgi:hypothetical protein
MGDPREFLPDESLTQFGEIFYKENTTLEDLGRYSVQLEPLPGQNRTSDVRFDVISYGKLAGTHHITILAGILVSPPSVFPLRLMT